MADYVAFAKRIWLLHAPGLADTPPSPAPAVTAAGASDLRSYWGGRRDLNP